MFRITEKLCQTYTITETVNFPTDENQSNKLRLSLEYFHEQRANDIFARVAKSSSNESKYVLQKNEQPRPLLLCEYESDNELLKEDKYRLWCEKRIKVYVDGKHTSYTFISNDGNLLNMSECCDCSFININNMLFCDMHAIDTYNKSHPIFVKNEKDPMKYFIDQDELLLYGVEFNTKHNFIRFLYKFTNKVDFDRRTINGMWNSYEDKNYKGEYFAKPFSECFCGVRVYW